MKRISLDGKWKLLCQKKNISIDAVVPGCVHTYLKNTGIVKDIFYRDNAEKYQWIENESWNYSREFFINQEIYAYERNSKRNSCTSMKYIYL